METDLVIAARFPLRGLPPVLLLYLMVCSSDDIAERVVEWKKMEELILNLKEEIIKVLHLEDLTPEDIDENAALFGEGLGLDSIDSLELIMLMEKNYGIKLHDPSQGKEIFKSVKVFANYIAENRKK